MHHAMHFTFLHFSSLVERKTGKEKIEKSIDVIGINWYFSKSTTLKRRERKRRERISIFIIIIYTTSIPFFHSFHLSNFHFLLSSSHFNCMKRESWRKTWSRKSLVSFSRKRGDLKWIRGMGDKMRQEWQSKERYHWREISSRRIFQCLAFPTENMPVVFVCTKSVWV